MKFKPPLIRRAGDRFILDESRVLPYMRKHVDVIRSAVTVVCNNFKLNPEVYESLHPEQKLVKLNSELYELLQIWGVYKG
jgi:hypothetical protein